MRRCAVALLAFVPAAASAGGDGLRAALKTLIQRSPLDRARVGVDVRALPSGEIVFQHNPDELLNPASNVKLFTAAAGLLRLGPEYRFTTEVYADPSWKPGDSTVGTLYLRGKGDPSLVSERLWLIAAELQHRGIKQVKNIVADDTFFDDQREGAGWDQENSDRPYMAPTGALSLNFNSVAVYVSPGAKPGHKARVELEPASGFFQLDNQVITAPSRGRQRIVISSIAAGERQRIMVRGRIPAGRAGGIFYKKIDNPPLYAAHTLRDYMERRGIAVRGKVRLGTAPAEAALVHAFESPQLGVIIRDLNKLSNNFIAEQLLKTLGAEVKGAPGTWAKGIAAAEDALAEMGIPRGSFVMKNGSGLNDTNRFSAAQLSRLLVEVSRRFPLESEFTSSLAVAGRDGTVRLRMDGTDAQGRLRAKTGTLENVSALSGYVVSAGGEKYAFAIVVNDFAGPLYPVLGAIDAMGALLAAAGSKSAEDAALAAATRGDEAASPAEFRARVATYAGLGRMQDKRNVPFLRTALRTERDPALRAVVAEALYLSDHAAGASVFLDSLQPTPEVFGRVWGAGRDQTLPAPGLSSLLDLAAEGSTDAVARLIAVARLTEDPDGAGRDAALRTALGEGLVEVGRTAPEELLEGLRAAGPEGSGAALEIIGGGMLSAHEPDHPFLKALRDAKTSPEGAVSEYAAEALARVEKAMTPREAEAACATPECAPAQPAPPAPETPAPSRPGGG
jgi:D-alanyl-D-alanine carboxypeptidase/D-alanyl-D-alanine-endopeptidase (penicillin-binding protein 4)